MEICSLGKTGIQISRLCIGGWQASGWASSDDNRFVTTISHALDCGINFIDTAESYGNGHSEMLIAKAIKGRRSQVVLASKFSHTHSRPPEIRRAFEASLTRLGTEYIDLYQYHWPAREPALEDTIAELELLKAEGKIRAIGVCNWMQPEWDEFSSPARIDCLQPCYSLLWRSIESKVLALCRAHSIAVIPYSPLCQGILAGRFKSLADVPKDFRKQNVLLTPERFPAALEVLKVLEDLAQIHHKPIAAVALRWLLDQPGITAPIIGVSSPAQVDQNLEALGWELPKEHWNRLAEISLPISANLKPHDTLWNWHPRTTSSRFTRK